jgi:anion-transporting  ArsA/GET3 family ATPase
MALILTFLGKGGVGRTTIAIAVAKRFASQGKRVLLATQDPAVSVLLGQSLTPEPQPLEANLEGLQLQVAALLEKSWEQLKGLETQYLRTPFFKEVYGQELGVLPGMDSALMLNAIREQDASGKYDVIVFDAAGDQALLRMLGMPEIASWYVRRFRQVFTNSDLGRAISPFLQPIAAAVLNVNWSSGDMFDQPATQEMNSILEQGKAALSDPNRVAAYLVTTTDTSAIATAQYLWGAAQQVGLTVGGVLLNRSQDLASAAQFSPLPMTSLPEVATQNWQPLIEALPDFDSATQMPRPIVVNVAERKVSLFLPTFDRKQVKLTQYGPEITIEAGDQRRNIFLPPELSGKPVAGAKFQEGFLIISF